jgi:Raf kinase inhibitor-like YbhB/YbcL family protein
MPMTITSTAFQEEEDIPAEYTCEGDNINPPLTFSGVPPETQSLILIMDDPDAPTGLFTHWIIFNMSPATMQILQNNKPETGIEGTNDVPKIGYFGPCPPSGKHHYFFKLYALKSMLNLKEGAGRQEVDSAIEDQIIDMAQLVGLYQKKKA